MRLHQSGRSSSLRHCTWPAVERSVARPCRCLGRRAWPVRELINGDAKVNKYYMIVTWQRCLLIRRLNRLRKNARRCETLSPVMSSFWYEYEDRETRVFRGLEPEILRIAHLKLTRLDLKLLERRQLCNLAKHLGSQLQLFEMPHCERSNNNAVSLDNILTCKSPLTIVVYFCAEELSA